MMPRGVWKDQSIAKRSAASRKAAATRGLAKRQRGFPDPAARAKLRAQADATRGSKADKELAGVAIGALIERLRMRGAEATSGECSTRNREES